MKDTSKTTKADFFKKWFNLFAVCCHQLSGAMLKSETPLLGLRVKKYNKKNLLKNKLCEQL